MSGPDPAWPRHGALWDRIEPRLPRADIAHDTDHVLRVYRWTLRLCDEAGADPDLAGAAALVHDLVNIPKDSPDRPLGSEQSAVAAAVPLAEAGYAPAEVAAIVEAVRTCGWSRGLAPTGPLGLVLQHADRLDAIGAVGIARNMATAQAMATHGSTVRFYDPADPAGRAERPLDDVRNAADHFRRKLLRIAETLSLPGAVAEARRRHAFLEAFLAELEREAGSA